MTEVLVTGATGFLGRAVVRALQGGGMTVTGVARTPTNSFIEGVELLHADLAASEAADVLSRRWDAIINLAGPVTGGYEDFATGLDVATAHTRIALNLRRHARSCRIVHTSSMTVYGMPQSPVVDETHPRRPEHLYGLGKVLAEDVLLDDPALDVWVLRLPGLFSATRTGGALYQFCRAARAGEPLRVSAETPTAWNILHVDDAATAVSLALAAPGHAGGAFNVSYDEPIELVAIARRIAGIAGTGSVVEHNGVEHPQFLLGSQRATARFGWKPPSLQDRLAELYEAYGAA